LDVLDCQLFGCFHLVISMVVFGFVSQDSK